MKNRKFIFNLTPILFLFVFTNYILQAQPFDNVDITAANSNGIRFWGGDNNYRIAMGTGSQYHYGPVYDYAIKTNMLQIPGRGWVWGSYAKTPVTALSAFGEFQTEGSIKSMQGEFLFGDNQRLTADNIALLSYHSGEIGSTNFGIFDNEGQAYGYLKGLVQGGLIFGLADSHGEWSYMAVKNEFTAFNVKNEEKMRIVKDGNVGIGTQNPQHKLEVCGIIRAKEVLVEESWCDFVFEPEYCLTTLEEEAEFIKLYGHLSNFESAKDMNGLINVNDIFKRQQIQIEENVLHLIELNEENEALQIQVDDLTDDVNTLNVELVNSNETIQQLIKRIEVLEDTNE